MCDCGYWKEQIEQWMETAWKSEGSQVPVPYELHSHIQHCTSCAASLEAAKRLAGQLSESQWLEDDPQYIQTKAAVTDRVMGAIEEQNTIQFVPDYPKKRSPRRWGQAIALAAASVVLLFTLTLSSPNESEELVSVRLELTAEQAETVAVVGDWNDWDPEAQKLQKTNQGDTWEIEIKVEPNAEYRYQFIVDHAEWIPDPDAPVQVEDGFGGVNSVLVI
ncbi:MAG: hypothetical protein ACQEQU_09655 [Spirochaetota bacterium]